MWHAIVVFDSSMVRNKTILDCRSNSVFTKEFQDAPLTEQIPSGPPGQEQKMDGICTGLIATT